MQEVVFRQAIHDGMNCKDYQDDLRIRAENDAAALQTKQLLTVSGQKGEHLQATLVIKVFNVTDSAKVGEKMQIIY